MMRGLVAIMSLLAASPAAPADQFDLVCKYGTSEIRYRVDTVRGEACEGACDRVWKMGPSTAGELRLKDTVTNYPDEIPQTVTVNRQTGALHHWIGTARGQIEENGICEAAPFSRFPGTKF